MANRVLDRVKVLALDATSLEVGAGAVRLLRSGLHDVSSVTGLRGDDRERTLLLDAVWTWRERYRAVPVSPY